MDTKTEVMVKNALDGNAILFLGAGFSVGATNINNTEFPIADGLCKELIKEGNIDVEGEEKRDLEDLGYISTRYLEEGNTVRDLITLLKNNYSCLTVGEEHKVIAAINWKRIYTTNYDDVMEFASRSIGKLREPVTASTHIAEVYNQKNAVIHMNGYVGNVTESNINSTFKLTEQSYVKRTIPDSEWAVALHNDIANAKSVIFIGYSLGYDLELQQIFSEDKTLKDKCIFVTFNPGKRALSSMKKFGEVYDKGLLEFSKDVAEIDKNYDRTKKEYELSCLSEYKKSDDVVSKVDSDSIINLLVNGIIDDNMIATNYKNNYVVERECINEAIEFLSEQGKVVVFHSDLANGKTVVMKQMEERLKQIGRIYHLDKLELLLADDLAYLASEKGLHFVFCENYNQIVDSPAWKIVSTYNYSNIKYIFTARSYINDNFYGRIIKDLKLDERSLAMYELNYLTQSEIRYFITYLNQYNLWGSQATLNDKRKEEFLSNKCNSEIRNILLEIYSSPQVIDKVNEILQIICKSEDCKNVLLMAFICHVMAIDISYDYIETVLGFRINPLYFAKYKEIKEFLLINGNNIKFKSSSIAYHIIVNNNFNNDILEIVCKMVNELTKHTYLSKNVSILKLIISFSNLRMIFNRKDKEINKIYIRFYENARKTQYYSENQFFWIQYALAVMEVHDYDAAEIYLENASSFSKERYSEESYQVESLRARLLLEKTMYDMDKNNAYENFEKAHKLICSNKTPERHYPYRQVGQYVEYYKKFYGFFNDNQKVAFMFMCTEINKKMNEYVNSSNRYERNNRSKSKEISIIISRLEKIIDEMGKSC